MSAFKPLGYNSVSPYLIVHDAGGTTWWIATQMEDIV